MKKNEKLNMWLWKWHFIAGLISLPFILVLSITGGIYLFKTDYETPRQKHIKEVAVQDHPITLQKQWEIATKNSVIKPNSMIIANAPDQATEFISGRFGGKSSIFINPYSGVVTGEIAANKTDMFLVRKLHGELLMGKFGTKIVELIASWMLVLLLTGLYIWWPSRKWSWKGTFLPRIKIDQRTFYRDLHSVTGFWFSLILLLVLAGGFPWTDIFGSNFKWVQKVTNTGYSSSWQGKQIRSTPIGNMISLDEVVKSVNDLHLPGEVKISFPKGKEGVFSISNTNPSDLESQKMIHYDAYSGKQIISLDWSNVGVLMRGRMWLMAFHQGEFGFWNWILMLLTAIALTVMSVSAIASYALRKKRKSWGVPKVHASFQVSTIIVVALVILSIIFPLFGISLLCILGLEFITKNQKNRKRV